MNYQLPFATAIALLCIGSAAAADAPQITINNNNNNNPPANAQQQNNCNNQANNQQGNNQRPGTYYTQNPNGGMDTVYTTGDKTPYVIDNNNCNNQPLVQPYIYGIPDNRPNPPRPRGR